MQLVAGILAGFAYALCLSNSFKLAPTKGYGWIEAGLAETLYTFMLCFVVLNVACSKRHAGIDQFYGLAIGFVIIAGGYGAGHISGGCFNPAVAFGIDVSGAVVGKFGFGWCLAYTCFEFAGAAMAAGLYRLCRPDEFSIEMDGIIPLRSKLLSEFLGTFILVLTVGLNVLGSSPAAAFSIAAALMCMIYALGSCSGAHFNPAVTLAIFIRKKISIKEAGYYVVVQILGGMTGAFTYALMEKRETFGLGPVGDYGWFAAAVAEIVFTFVLCYVVLCVATTEKGLSNYFGLAIGMCVTVGGYAIGAVSGGSLNPAVSIAIASSHLLNKGAFWQCLVYSLFEFMGAGAAAGLFMVTHADEFKQDKQALEQ
eukprot:gnl/TRDRNA2_/TRDRNA2_174230_c4_seq18.p1 gnl/TRDRNA2_/TRDRNA2_174230_c4~~gnl/TRDRNA2_/TRDRNA2_174230_c4_seq18.p1  ORF type:complete len:383 (-),score=90.88 gnl/TRDRNA2_/TRDRNA2_174230_c4_seq18:158-1261(-)